MEELASTTQNSAFTTFNVCVSVDKNLHYNGVFFGQNPMDHTFPAFMLQIILSISISRIIHVILSPLRQSKFVCNILAGVLLGPSVLGRNKTYMEKIFATEELAVHATLSQMAVYLWVFIVCIKADASMFTTAAKNTWKLGLCCFAFPIIFTTALTLSQQYFLPGPGLLTPKIGFPIQLNVVLSLSFFVVITHALDELNLLSSELGQLSSSITCLNEVLTAIFLIIAIILRQKETIHSVYAVLSLSLLVMLAVFVIRPILFWIINNTPKGKPVEECYVVAILLFTFLLGLIADAVGAYFATASMIIGFIIPNGPPLGTTIVRKCQPIIFEILLPVFFVRIGYYTDLSTIQDFKEFMVFGALLGVGYLGRLVACLLVSSSMNMKKSNVIFLSLILSLQGVIEIVQAIRMRHARLIDDQTFTSVVVFVVVLNVTITPIIAILYKPLVEKIDMPTSTRVRSRSLGMTMMTGELQIITCIQEEDNILSIISLLEAMNPKDVSSICAYVIHLVVVSTKSVPKLALYKNHLRMFCQPSGSDNIIRVFLNYAGHSQSPVQIHPFRMISPYKYMHQHICGLGETIHTPLIIVPFFKTEETHDTDGTLRIFNTNIQAIAKCTVGILVDRGLRSPISLTTFSYNMAVIFFGGVDDREALALASRASRHPNVRITVLRVDMSGNHNRLEYQIEKGVDNALFGDFKAMNVNNDNVVCDEIVTRDIEDVMKAIRSLGKDYDIVVVGKRQKIPELQALASWVQYQELGEIGDAIASPDFLGGRMSVLVLQHCADENQRVSENFSYFSL